MNEINSYAGAFATEIRNAFADAVLGAANGLAITHALDSLQVEDLLWQTIAEELNPGPEDLDFCVADETP